MILWDYLTLTPIAGAQKQLPRSFIPGQRGSSPAGLTHLSLNAHWRSLKDSALISSSSSSVRLLSSTKTLSALCHPSQNFTPGHQRRMQKSQKVVLVVFACIFILLEKQSCKTLMDVVTRHHETCAASLGFLVLGLSSEPHALVIRARSVCSRRQDHVSLGNGKTEASMNLVSRLHDHVPHDIFGLWMLNVWPAFFVVVVFLFRSVSLI